MRSSLLLLAAVSFLCACDRGMVSPVPSPASASKPATPHPAPTSRAATAQKKAIDDASVIRIVANQIGVAAAQITPSMTLESLKMDELDLVEIVMELEDTFEISIPDERFGGDLIGKTILRRLTVHDLVDIARDAQAHPVQTHPATRPASPAGPPNTIT